jgi:hypothetical protein
MIALRRDQPDGNTLFFCTQDGIEIRHMDLEVQPSAKRMFKLSSDSLPILHELLVGYFIECVDLLKHQGGAARATAAKPSPTRSN